MDVGNTGDILSPVLKDSWNHKIILPAGTHTLIGDEQGNLSLFGHVNGVEICSGEQNIQDQRADFKGETCTYIVKFKNTIITRKQLNYSK